MTRCLLLAVFLAATPTAQGQAWEAAQDPAETMRLEAQMEAHRAHTARLVQALAKTGHARDLAFAAMLRGLADTGQGGAAPSGDAPSRRVPADPEAAAWLRTAAAEAGDDVLAHQLVAAAAGGTDAATRSAAAKRWQAAEPGNLVPLLYLDLPAEALLAAARQAADADTHMYAGVRWMRSALAKHPPTADEQRALAGDEPFLADEAAAMAATAYWAGAALPSYQGLVQACRGTALHASPARAGDCRHAATLLADRSDNALGERVGLSMLAELVQRGPERAGVEARQRRMDWQMQQWGRLASQQPRDGAAQFVRLLDDPSIRSERQLAERVLQEGGVPPEPPQGWHPPRY